MNASFSDYTQLKQRISSLPKEDRKDLHLVKELNDKLNKMKNARKKERQIGVAFDRSTISEHKLSKKEKARKERRSLERRERKASFDLYSSLNFNYEIDGQSNVTNISCKIPSADQEELRALLAFDLKQSFEIEKLVKKTLNRAGEEKAINLLVSMLDILIQIEAYQDINTILSHLHPKAYSPNLIAAALVTTKPIAENLITRHSFIESFKDYIKDLPQIENYL